MALIPTHIRFALDLADSFEITDMSEFISGTVYPDSRWVTGIDRDLTHHQRFLDKSFGSDDFTLGWHLHCVCDQLQKEVHQPFLKDHSSVDRRQEWIFASVLKVIEDRNDLQQIDLEKQLQHLNDLRNPNGENPELIRKFYDVMRSTYAGVHIPSAEDYGQMWLAVGLDRETTQILVSHLEKGFSDTKLCHTVADSYQQILALYRLRI